MLEVEEVGPEDAQPVLLYINLIVNTEAKPCV